MHEHLSNVDAIRFFPPPTSIVHVSSPQQYRIVTSTPSSPAELLSAAEPQYEVRLEFLQQYLDQVYDLFDDGKKLSVREIPGYGVLVENSTLVEVSNFEDACEILSLAIRNRKIGEVHLEVGRDREGGRSGSSGGVMGPGTSSVCDSEISSLDSRSTMFTKHLSSRSHALLTLHVRKRQFEAGTPQQRECVGRSWGKFTLGDLAGSERNNQAAQLMGFTDSIKMQEAKAINVSLAALGNVISSLAKMTQGTSNGNAKKKFSHIPWRDSKLTKLLWDSVDRGGVHVLCTVHADRECVSETVSSLTFASRCKKVQLCSLPRF